MIKKRLPLLTLILTLNFTLSAEDYKPQLFKSMELIYENDFSKDGPPSPEQWTIRQSSTWIQKDGILHGSEAPKDFQKKKLASPDPTHAGLRPVIFLTPIPEDFVFQCRLRYDGKFTSSQCCELSFGHHLQEFKFGKDSSTFTLHKDKKTTQKLKDLVVPLGKWVEVTAELTKGRFIVTIDGVSKTYENSVICLIKSDGEKSYQIDFKGLNFGTVQIDWVKLYKGIK